MQTRVHFDLNKKEFSCLRIDNSILSKCYLSFRSYEKSCVNMCLSCFCRTECTCFRSWLKDSLRFLRPKQSKVNKIHDSYAIVTYGKKAAFRLDQSSLCMYLFCLLSHALFRLGSFISFVCSCWSEFTEHDRIIILFLTKQKAHHCKNIQLVDYIWICYLSLWSAYINWWWWYFRIDARERPNTRTKVNKFHSAH